VAKKPAASGPTTAATVALTKAGVHFTPHAYPHDAAVTDFGEEAATALGVDPDRVFKTLMVESDAGLGIGIVPVSGMLDLKALAAALGGKKAAMADLALAERKSGYVVGGISPFGQRTALPTVLDESALDHQTIFVSGGRRGFDIEISPTDLLAVTRGTAAPIRRV
jgi:Cys-tRNA(Pro)/Cys-tRNA(Cys) deacylase